MPKTINFFQNPAIGKKMRTCVLGGAFLIGAVMLVVDCGAQSLGWQTISGVPGCFTVAVGKDGKTFAASPGSQNYDGRVYSTTDYGESWYPTAINYGLIFEVSARGPHIIVSRNLSSGRTPYQVFLSHDNGLAWQGVLSGDILSAPLSGFMYSDRDSIYAVGGFVSGTRLVKRNGQRWDPVGKTIPLVSFHLSPFPLPDSFIPVPTAIDGEDRIYVGTVASGLFMTTNYGSTWTQALPQLEVTALSVRSPSRIVVATSPNISRNGGIFVSADSGVTWTFLGLSDRAISAVAVDDANAIYASTDNGIYQYGGTPNSWINISPLPEAFGGVTVPAPNVVMAASRSKGLFRTTNNGGTWERSGISEEDVSALIVTPQQAIIAGTYGDRIFRSIDAGGSWRQLSSGLTCDNVFSLGMVDAALFVATDCGVVVSSDEGDHWSNVSQGFIAGGAFALAKDGLANIYAGTNFGVYRSPDTGRTWQQSGLIGSKVTGMAAGAGDDIFAMTSVEGVFKSSDHGASWMSLGLVENDLQSIAVNAANTIFVGGAGRVYISTNDGVVWNYTLVSEAFVYSLALRDASTIVAGTGQGIFVSTNEGQTWVPRSGGLSQTLVLSVAVDNQGYVYAGTYHGGAYRSVLPLTSVEHPGILPSSFELSQNYPNPFNPKTDIRYTIPLQRDGQIGNSRNVTLRIFDLLGREIAALVNERKEPGEYIVSWDAGNLPSGIYFYRLTAGQVTATKKMLLVR